MGNSALELFKKTITNIRIFKNKSKIDVELEEG